MELVQSNIAMREDNSFIMLTHLSQLLSYMTGFGGFIVPLILWLTKKDDILGLDEHGKSILNFQLSLLVYIVIGIPGILLFGLGILLLIFAAIIGFVLPIVNAIRAHNGESPSYFATIRFLK